MLSNSFKAYTFPIILIGSIILGGFAGVSLGPKALVLKPLGEIFLNLIYTAIVPLIFFSVSNTIAKTDSLSKLGKTLLYMIMVFLFTGFIAAVYMLIVVKLFPPAQDVFLNLPNGSQVLGSSSISDKLVQIFTVPDFTRLFSHENILPLIVFSMLLGFAVSNTKEKTFNQFLQAGENISMKIFTYIMYLAPIGFFAYFATTVSELGINLIQSYLRITIIYYIAALFYFVFAFSFYAFLAGGIKSVKLFWGNIFLPTITSIATCSSAACIPANLIATQKMKVSPLIYETVIPLGAMIHKDGSVLGGIIKIAFLFGIYHLNFAGPSVLITAIFVALLVGTVMGAIPSGGMIGEVLILNFYGFPPSALMAIVAISLLIDPIATMLNVTGDSVSSMLVARGVEEKKR